MRRRQFIAGLGSAAAWPVLAQAQRGERMRHIGALSPGVADDPEYQTRNAAFLQGLGELGWSVGRNVRIDYRWGGGDAERIRKYAAELVALAPDVILATGAPVMEPLLRATRTVPIVFVQVVDPIGAGLVASLARPGGNATGFTGNEYAFHAKLVELLKEVAPSTTRIAVLRDATSSSGIGIYGAIQSAAATLKMELFPIGVSDTGEIERALAAFASSSNGGLIVTGNTLTILHRELIITLAARYRLPAVYTPALFASSGAFISYGQDTIEPYRRAAGYIDRILKGGKPANLPVQEPIKYELVINLKTAKALGLTVPQSILLRADEVIE
jgi:putative ABC transport system substrate-binding protein